MLGPRLGVHRQRERILMGNAQNSLIGLFMMWWAFLAFNSGSTFGVSEAKWMFSAKATVTTMVSSFGGGCVGLAICYVFYRGKVKVMYVANCVFSSLVAITGTDGEGKDPGSNVSQNDGIFGSAAQFRVLRNSNVGNRLLTSSWVRPASQAHLFYRNAFSTDCFHKNPKGAKIAQL